MSRRENNPAAMAIPLFAVLLSLFVLIGVIIVRSETERQKQQELEQVQLVINDMGTSLTSRLYYNIHKVEGVKALVALNPDLTQDDFARAMEVQFRGEHDLRNIGLARNMILRFMYPVEGNEAAIGLDYTTLPNQFPAVELARRLNKTVLAGPLTLVQGGEGIIARIPIYLTVTDAYPEGFWGFASVVMDSYAIFNGAGVKEEHLGVRIAIRGKDAGGAQGEVFWGDPLVFEKEPVVRYIDLPHGSWQMGAIPAMGWSRTSIPVTPLLTAYLVAVVMILAFNAVILFLFIKMRKAERVLQQSKQDLEMATARAQTANEAKSRYLAHMNHEIRTPLNGFMGFLQLMEGTQLNEQQQEFMHHMKQSTSHLLSIVNNVLDYAKIEAGDMQLDHHLFFLEEEIQTALSPLRSLARQKNLLLQLTMDKNLPTQAEGDPDRLRQVILNLGGNAVKFTWEGQVHITIGCTETTQDYHVLQLVVEDTGPGMTQQIQEKLFQPFYQADDGSVPQSKGTGLGMPITQELLTLMNGSIQVDSAPGKGTRVEVYLMLKKARSNLDHDTDIS